MFEEVLNKLNAFIADAEAVKRQLAAKDEEINRLKQQIDNDNAEELRQLDEAIARLEAALRV